MAIVNLQWDAELQLKSRNILLLLDNCGSHPNRGFKNIQLMFFPPKTTSILQPLDMGIIRNLKILYKDKLVSYILQQIDSDLLQQDSSALEVSRKINLWQAIQFIAKSWREVSQRTVQNCFAHCGWRYPREVELLNEVIINENEIITPQLQSVVNYEEFCGIDDDLICFDIENYEIGLVEEIIQQTTEVDE